MSAELNARRSIVVLADDLSGAAELAGIACTAGLTAEVQREYSPASGAEVIAVDSNTRGLVESAAVEKIAVLARHIAASRPAWIFKKVDSLLRGHVRAEIEAILMATGQQRAVLIPANPSRSRTIRDGIYLIDGVPLDRTALACDPEHPRHFADVARLLGGGGAPLYCIRSNVAPPLDGICVPDVWEAGHLEQRVKEVDSLTLPAGAADFFAALLRCWAARKVHSAPQSAELLVRLPALLVCGSQAAWHSREAEAKSAGLPIVNRKEDPAVAIRALRQGGAALLAIGGELAAEELRGQLLYDLAERAALVLQQSSAATLLVEGGATAEAIAERLGWSRFAGCAPGPAGVGVLQPIGDATVVRCATHSHPSPRVLVKPGSYPWPAEIWVQLRPTE